MMSIQFYKYQGAGNDFIIFDNRDSLLRRDLHTWIAQICDRRFGIGADGVMFLQNHSNADFEMVYYNADGGESSMCGNGGRCIVNFAKKMGLNKESYSFLAADGMHEAKIKGAIVYLKMKTVKHISHDGNIYTLDTGSPHYVEFIEQVDTLPVKELGAKIRFSSAYAQEGINVNFVEKIAGGISMRTYERGVEDETLSCGTGVTAAAIAYGIQKQLDFSDHTIAVHTKGGELTVTYTKVSNTLFENIWLIGNGEFVFEGRIDMPQA